MQTLNFLFWNLNSKNLVDEIGNIAATKGVDILILAECEGLSDSELLLKLNEKETRYSANNPASLCKKIKIFTRFSYNLIPPKMEGDRWNIFDQVLIRPSLIANFVQESINILDNDGVKSLITKKRYPNKQQYSDHLPSFFTLKLNEL